MSDQYPGLKWEKSPLPCLPDFYDYEATVVLQEATYTVRLNYNRRGQYWAMSLYDANGTTLVAGRKLVANWPAVDKLPQARPAYGQIIPFAEVDVPVEQADLGSAFVPCFLTLVRE